MGFQIENGVLIRYQEEPGVTEVVIPDYVTSIGRMINPYSRYFPYENAFCNCTSLISITIPEGVRRIGEYAFYNCSSLTSLTIPESVSDIVPSAFEGCTSLTSIDVKSRTNACLSLDGVLYDKSGKILLICPPGKTSVIIPEGTTKIIGNAFHCCTLLSDVTIPDSVTEIGRNAFKGCKALRNLTISDYTLDGTQCDLNNVSYSAVKTMLKNRDYTVKMDPSAKYHIVTQVFFQKSQPEAEAYIKQNITEIIKHFINRDDYNTVKALLDTGKFVTENNIDESINNAIEHTQNGGDMQIQIYLTNYKYEKLGI